MNARWQSIINTVSQMLSPEEREIFLGDIEELGVCGRHAAQNLVGLIIRRQIQPWFHWRQWLILVALLVPLSIWLSIASSHKTEVSAVYIWMYANNWTPAFLGAGYFWSELVPQMSSMCSGWIVLVCWSWTGGVVLDSVSRVPAWLNATLVSLFCLLMAISLEQQNPGNDAVFDSYLYRVIFPILFQIILVLLPFSFGMRHRRSFIHLQPKRKAILWSSIGISFASLLSGVIADRLHFIPSTIGYLAIAGPATYFFIKTDFRCWHRIHTCGN